MPLLTLHDLHIAFGGRPLLAGASLTVERGERVGLVGRNGEGKSTLLRILADRQAPDQGTVATERGARVALLDQHVPEGLDGTVESVVARDRPPATADHEIQRLLSILQLDPGAPFAALSGGQKRRALLGRALAAAPDLLLLDEPTNHLDLGSIEWLEGFLARRSGALLFVTHDRAFLQALATRIVEIDRGQLTSWACDYPTYLERREERLAAEEKEWERADKKLAQEEAWIRQGIKARRTRNEGRVRALERLRADRAARRDRVGDVRLAAQSGERTGKRVIETEDLSFSWGDEPIVRGLSTVIERGDRVGLIGPNGCGKTTLLGLLLGETAPDEGRVRHGTNLQVAYFDQHRQQLDEDASIFDNVAHGNDHVVIDGERRHVASYLEDFLFSSARARQPVSSLSGGERNRLLLARLFTRPANVLVLDEPTNDLDAETLELLESLLLEWDGTVLLVSHDRSFLDALCTSTLVFEGAGVVREHAGGYSDWKRVAERRAAAETSRTPARKTPAERPRTTGARKLAYREQRELEELPARIETLERERADVHAALADPDLYREDPEGVRALTERLPVLDAEIETAYARWSELDAIATV